MSRRGVADDEVALPKGYWPAHAVREILDKTLSLRLDGDLDATTPGERLAIDSLVEVGRVLGDLNAAQRHHQALPARHDLEALHERLGRPSRTADLLDLYGLFIGPIATTLDNELEPFLPVDGFTEGKSFYPWGIERAEIEAFCAAHPERQSEILDPHSVVRRTTPRALKDDLLTLRRHPTLSVLHPGLDAFLAALAGAPEREALYAVPFSVAWPGPIFEASRHLSAASVAIADDDPDAAAFLRQRARDLLTDDNEAGDAAWIRGGSGRFDAVIGAYEVYEDGLFGAKAAFGVSIHQRDDAATARLRSEMVHLPEIEAALPYESRRQVQTDIPVASVNVLAAFGAGVDVSAEILPNDADLRRKYGRKILVRRNHLMHPALFSRLRTRWESVIAPAHLGDLTPDGLYQQVVWHEVGHYLGPEADGEGRPIDTSLGADAQPIEELKADLLAVFATDRLRASGIVDEATTRAVAASLILACLRPVRPLRSQPYATLQLMALNAFLDGGYLVLDGDRLGIRHDRRESVVRGMLADVLAIQVTGSSQGAASYIDRYTTWDERHERLARTLTAVEQHRFLDSRYGLLEAAGASSSR